MKGLELIIEEICQVQHQAHKLSFSILGFLGTINTSTISFSMINHTINHQNTTHQKFNVLNDRFSYQSITTLHVNIPFFSDTDTNCCRHLVSGDRIGDQENVSVSEVKVSQSRSTTWCLFTSCQSYSNCHSKKQNLFVIYLNE